MAFDTSSFEVITQEYETLLTYQREDPETQIPCWLNPGKS